MNDTLKPYGIIPLTKKIPCFAKIIFLSSSNEYYVIDGNTDEYFFKKVHLDQFCTENIIILKDVNFTIDIDIKLLENYFSYYIPANSIFVGLKKNFTSFVKKNIQSILKKNGSLETLCDFIEENELCHILNSEFTKLRKTIHNQTKSIELLHGQLTIANSMKIIDQKLQLPTNTEVIATAVNVNEPKDRITRRRAIRKPISVTTRRNHITKERLLHKKMNNQKEKTHNEASLIKI